MRWAVTKKGKYETLCAFNRATMDKSGSFETMLHFGYAMLP